MFLVFFDGLDALIEHYIPAAKEYPIALVIYLLIVAVLIFIPVFVIWAIFLRKKSDE